MTGSICDAFGRIAMVTVLAVTPGAVCAARLPAKTEVAPLAWPASFGAQAAGADHVYTSGYPAVLRFPIVHGIVSGTPDATYSNIPYAAYVSRQGEIFQAAGGSGTLEISVYATAGGRLLRSFSVTRPAGWPLNSYSTAMGVDRAGFTYVGLLGNRLGVHTRNLFAVAVFAPRAQGNPDPVAMVSLKRTVTGMAFDAAGNLFVAEQDRTVDIFQNPHSSPTHLRSLVGGPIRHIYGGITIDDSDELYLGCGDARGPSVLAYPASATDPMKPDRAIHYAQPPPTQEKYPTGVAVSGNELYVADRQVLEFDKRVGGLQKPIATVQEGEATQVWTAP